MNSAEESIQILYVDEDRAVADVVETYLEAQDERFSVTTAGSTAEGLDRLASDEIDCIVSDFDMPGQNGIEFVETVRQNRPDFPFILFTGKGSEEIASRAISSDVTDYLQKQTGTEQYELLANRIDSAVVEYKTRRFQQVTQHDPIDLLECISDAFLA